MRIKEFREIKGMSQFSLAKASGVSQGLISLYERHLKEPGIGNVVRIANALEISIEDLIDKDLYIS